ncbi:MAG: hypothetical protein SFV19_18265 [Rhodospirillaceae bacterium]|nr:hypothetical protein [Rhodospirillaceae bacterium]
MSRSVLHQPRVPADRDDGAKSRIAREREKLDVGLRDLAAGRVVKDRDVDAMLDRFVDGKPLKLPTQKSK